MEYVKNDKASYKRILYPPQLTLEFTPASLMEDNAHDNGVFQKLAEMLIDKNNVHHFFAEKLSVSFFKSILEMMDEGDTVEVEGLGTFLLTKVKVADAVYGKVAFVPDEKLASVINSPFSFFSPVELTDGVHFDDLDENGAIDVETKSDDKVFLISRELSNCSEDTASQQEDSDNMYVEDGQSKESLAKVESMESEVNDTATTSQIEGDNSGERKRSNYIIHALIAVMTIACVLLAWNLISSDKVIQDESKDNVASSDTLIENSNKDGSVGSSEKNDGNEEQDSSTTLDFASLNAKIPYGGYDIIGVASEIKVAPGMTLQKIAQIYLGTEHTIYLEVLNDGKEPQPGEMYKIPVLQLRKK